MAVQRQLNIKGSWRVDVPHLRALESAVANDFDVLAGKILGGKQPYIVRGFAIVNAAVGLPATNLILSTAGGVVLHYGASVSGSILGVSDDRPDELLNVSNSRVVGGFTNSQTNYIGLDFIRRADTSTNDLVQFLDASTEQETPKTVPLSRTLDYRIVVSTTPFSSALNVCPVAIVVLDANGNVSSWKDARSMYFRLAAGGDSPNPLGLYAWPQGRSPESVTLFTGGDKAITHEREWKAAVMQRLWELSGGEYWYSDTSDRNIKFVRKPVSVLTDNFTFDGTTLKWEAISIVLTNSTATVNNITNNTSTGVALGAGQCVYVDIDRYNDGATLTMQGPVAISSLGIPTRVGSRYVVAWRPTGSSVAYARGQDTEIGRAINIQLATTSVTGIVRTSASDQISGNPVAVVIDASNLGRAQGISSISTAAGLTFQDTLVAGSALVDFTFNSTTTRTAGTLFSVSNNGSARLTLTPTGNLTVSGTLTCTAITASDSTLELTGALTVSGTTTLSNTLGGTAATFSTTLGVTGIATFSNTLTLNQAADQSISKSGGALKLVTSDANAILLVTNNATRWTVAATGNLSGAGTNTIDNIPDPTTDLKVSNKQYVDNQITARTIDNKMGWATITAGGVITRQYGGYTFTCTKIGTGQYQLAATNIHNAVIMTTPLLGNAGMTTEEIDVQVIYTGTNSVIIETWDVDGGRTDSNWGFNVLVRAP